MSTSVSAPLDEHLAHPRRLIALEAVHNFRDLGGYPAVTPNGDPATTRWGVLYRADGLYRLTPADLEIIRELRLRTVVDLRSHAEVEEHGTFPHDRCPVELTHFPVIDSTWNADDARAAASEREFLVWAYGSMLDEGATRFAAAFEQLARPGALPAVFHCAAGKDRTGILAALVLESIGVARDYVLGDYALTAAGIERMRAWALREFPEAAERMAETPSAFFAALPEAMGDLLDRLEAEHGSVRTYVRAIGVSDAAVDALAAQLLEPAG